MAQHKQDSNSTQQLHCYMVCSSETVLREDARRAHFKQWHQEAGHRPPVHRITVDKAKDWQRFVAQVYAQSLFDTLTILYVHAKVASMTTKSIKLFMEYLAKPCADKKVLVEWIDWQKNDQKKSWFKALVGHKNIQVRCLAAVPAYQLESWLLERLQRANIRLSHRSMQHLLVACEGNSSAAAHWIDQLSWVQKDGQVSEALVQAMVGNRAQYSAYHLIDAALSGIHHKVHACYARLVQEDGQWMAAQGALVQTLRQLVRWFSLAQHQQLPVAHIVRLEKLWASKQKRVLQALERHTLNDLKHLLWQAHHAQFIHHGLIAGANSDVLLQAVFLQLSGALPLDTMRQANQWTYLHQSSQAG
jgi:DNA polymerase III delta subunit